MQTWRFRSYAQFRMRKWQFIFQNMRMSGRICKKTGPVRLERQLSRATMSSNDGSSIGSEEPSKNDYIKFWYWNWFNTFEIFFVYWFVSFPGIRRMINPNVLCRSTTWLRSSTKLASTQPIKTGSRISGTPINSWRMWGQNMSNGKPVGKTVSSITLLAPHQHAMMFLSMA